MRDIEERIKKLLVEMTAEEKIGQLIQCGPSLVGAFEVSFEELLDMMFDGRISQEEFGKLMSTATQDFHEDDIRAGKIGSFNGIKNAETANRLQKIAVEESRLGIPLLFGYDVIHGYRTIFPIPLAESCAWDPVLWEKTARIAAIEATAAGVHMTFAPMVDVAKDARWGRVSEGAGEDAYLTSVFGTAKVKGFQDDDLSREDSMAACIKHFAGYGAAEAGRDYNRVDMSMQRLFEEYMPPFEACVKAGARAVMPAFNDINGIPCSVSRWLLTDILRNRLGFDGMTVSDSNAIAECVDHGIAKDRSEAAKLAIEAGMDMDMSSNVYAENLPALLERGVISEADLDRAVTDIMRIKFELGLFDHPYQTSCEREKETLLRPEYRACAREAAAKSMVLLKNEGVLPLKKEIRIGIAGELADQRAEMTGAWAIGANGDDCVSIIDACNASNINYVYTPGIENGVVNKKEIERLSKNCDVWIAAVGEKKDQSGEAASRADIGLPKEQEDLLEALLQTGIPVAAVLFNGRPLAIPWAAKHVPAILEAWHPGVEAGNAVLDILFGDVNPSAKLTTTFPYTTGQCPMYYAHINTGRPGGKGKFTSKYLDTPLSPVFPFGYGLSYTSFEYSNLSIRQEEDMLHILVDVKNTGKAAGEEIVQCYTGQKTGRRVRPVKQLRSFEKIALDPGETKKVSFDIDVKNLGYYDWNMNYTVDRGAMEIFVGTSSVEGLKADIVLK
ncbi:MAG: glycoside hydrolase family 3 C-terminal domain-containing protein [Clostridiales bacterium]|nr:glycoside hydrolase family 3 C-terminal domain-containing protein [Clostridiales bacterium]MDY3746131.1 glycoside hydrolase family 3 N-terminal domain-containing protein [Lachnospiraceae bacterium]